MKTRKKQVGVVQVNSILDLPQVIESIRRGQIEQLVIVRDEVAGIYGKIDKAIEELQPALQPVADDRICRECGCTDTTPCVDEKTDEPCSWAEADLCSACAGAKGDAPEPEVTDTVAARIEEIIEHRGKSQRVSVLVDVLGEDAQSVRSSIELSPVLYVNRGWVNAV